LRHHARLSQSEDGGFPAAGWKQVLNRGESLIVDDDMWASRSLAEFMDVPNSINRGYGRYPRLSTTTCVSSTSAGVDNPRGLGKHCGVGEDLAVVNMSRSRVIHASGRLPRRRISVLLEW
jgi:hypothetical protein